MLELLTLNNYIIKDSGTANKIKSIAPLEAVAGGVL